MASLGGHTDIAKMLVENGANVNAISFDKKTALGIAKEKRHAEIVKLLEDAGAMDAVDGEGIIKSIRSRPKYDGIDWNKIDEMRKRREQE